jgi:hypothetical protein
VATFGSNISLIATALFFYVVFDMLVYGSESGRRSGYSLKVITQIQFLLVLFTKKISKGLADKKLILLTATPLVVSSAIFENLTTYFSNQDMARPWQFGFQDPATNLMEGIIDLHHDIVFFLIGVVILVAFLMTEFVITEVAFNNSESQSLEELPTFPMQVQHNTFIEIV